MKLFQNAYIQTQGAIKILERIVKMLALIGGVTLMGLMCLIVYSVFMRRVFNAPPLGVYDTAEVMLLPIVAFSLAYTGLTKGHIAVDLISMMAKKSTIRWSDTIVLFVSAVIISLLTVECFSLVSHAIEVNEVTQMVEIPYYPFMFMLATGSGIFAIVLFRQAWHAFLGKEETTPHE